MSDSILDLNVLRRTALRLILIMIWLQAALVVAACIGFGTSIWGPAGAALAIAGAAQGIAYWDRDGGQARIVAGVSLMASISVLIAVFSGQKIQVDLHMYYFAALALLVACCDWRVIAAAATTVALHHVTLNFLLPALIYPGGSDIFRLALHAVILVLEASVLAWLALTLERMFSAIKAETVVAETSRIDAEKNHQNALAAAAQAEIAHRIHEQDQARVAKEDGATLQSLASALEHLAAGDLTYRIVEALPAKAEAIRTDFNSAMEKLQAAMLAILESAQGIRGRSGEISVSADELSRRTEKQAAGLEESAATLDQITATVRNTAQGIVHARKVVNNAKSNAERSGLVVHQAVDAMNGIEQSSVKITQIIGVIDEIAFQTNLLALNAGVEAARAGEAGRGFAVVASEVRALAQRSAEAAKEIKALISTSTQQVEAGVDLVDQAGKTMEEIASQVAELDGVMTSVATTSQDQATNLNQVNSAVNQMDQVTQQNAAMVEETTAASHSLMEETERLAQLLSSFKVGAGEVIAMNAGRAQRRRAS
ncbi:methyl-accepting chemotaxis protein [Methylovirgula sp. HY1]|uniref:methyl-accepting chemotaxis protein n=1 Tax=Methylovirgula sp. HY1 TaxID=2822761 RepID=UPI001C758B5A|nr:methyl-accepting chemotaxis protein [Methylovirgula sp. HY1]QXX74661.1 Methyl-accepting chemotaxis protein III [Methylovirgula sp. HY1]